jgi:hypothetical protein
LTRLNICQRHVNLYHHQRDAYHSIRQQLQPGQLLVIMDFTKYHLPIIRSNANDANGKTITDYILSVPILNELTIQKIQILSNKIYENDHLQILNESHITSLTGMERYN